MILIIVGIVLIVLIEIYLNRLPFFNKGDILGDSFKATICIIVAMAIMAVGFGIPLHGFDESVMEQEYELVEIVDGSNVYVVEDENRIPFFKYVKASSESSTSDPYGYSNIEIVVSDKYEKPTLVRYKRKPKRSVLTFAVFGNGYDYKIYAAEENIKRFK